MNQFDVGGKHVFQSEAVDGVRMAAADFHDAIVAFRIGKAANLLGRLGNQFGFAEFIDKSHLDSPFTSSNRSSSGFDSHILQSVALHFLIAASASPSTRSVFICSTASCSLILLMANPT